MTVYVDCLNNHLDSLVGWLVLLYYIMHSVSMHESGLDSSLQGREATIQVRVESSTGHLHTQHDCLPQL